MTRSIKYNTLPWPRINTAMDVHIIIGKNDEKLEVLEELRTKSLADEITFIAENEKTSSELLTDLIYEDFVRCR